MPVSKHRKNAARKYVPKTPTPVKNDSWAFKLHSSRVLQLRKDPDFLTMVKVGRAMNALAYALTDVALYHQERNITEKRQYRRAGFVLGGYLHEAVTVVDRIKGRYLGDPAFEPLRVLIVEPEYRKVRKYARTVRNCLAFHLDESDATTSRTLSRLKPSNYTVMCGDDLTYASFYFEFSDYLDIAYLVDQFADGRDWDETAKDIIFGMQDYANEFLMACHTFLQMLWKTKIAQHVY